MPHNRTPNDAEVLAAHLAICLLLFSADASSPCCLVPIFRSNIQGLEYLLVIFSSRRKSKFACQEKYLDNFSLLNWFTWIEKFQKSLEKIFHVQVQSISFPWQKKSHNQSPTTKDVFSCFYKTKDRSTTFLAL